MPTFARPGTVALCFALLWLAAAFACSSSDRTESPQTDHAESTTSVSERTSGSLADLIDASPSGGTVLVPAGHYHEQIEISKPLTFKAAGDGTVIIDGECERDFGVRITTGSGIEVSGIQIKNTVSAGVLIGLEADGDPPADHVTIDGLTVSDFDCKSDDVQHNAGIAVWNAACCMTLTNNTIIYRTEGDGHGRGDGIWFKSNTEKPSGGGHRIANNTILGGWDGIGGENEDDPHGTFDSDTIIEGNHVSGCWDDGIQVEGGDINVQVRDNEIEGCGTGIAFAAAVTGPLYVKHNYVHDLQLGLYENLFCYKIGNAGEGVVYLTENFCRTRGDGLLQTNEGISPIVSEGNCFDVSRYVLETDGELPPGSSFDRDIMWTSDPERFIKWGEARYDDIATFYVDTGFEPIGERSRDCPLEPWATQRGSAARRCNRCRAWSG